MEDTLVAIPDIKGVFFFNQAVAQGAAAALAAANRTDVQLVSFDLDPVSYQMVKDGKILGLVVQDPFKMGYEGMNSMVTKLQGGTPVARMDIPTRMLTKDNAGRVRRRPAGHRQVAGLPGESRSSACADDRSAAALLDCRGIVKSLRRRPGAPGRGLRGAPRPRPWPGRRERGRQVDADQGAGRALPARCRHAGAGRQAAEPARHRRCAGARHRHRPPGHQPDRDARPWRRTCSSPTSRPSARSGSCGMGAMRAQAAELLARYGIAVSPDSKVADLTNDQRKMVQIVKAISRRARVLLLDEPTSSLTDERGPAGPAPDPRSGGPGHRHRVHLALPERGVRGLRRDHRAARRCRGAGAPRRGDTRRRKWWRR